MPSHCCCFDVVAVQVESKREIPERGYILYRIVRATIQNCFCVFSKNLALVDKCAALFLQVRGSLFPKLPLLVYEVPESCESDKNDHAQDHDDDAEISLSPKKRYFFRLGPAQLFLLFSAASCFL